MKTAMHLLRGFLVGVAGLLPGFSGSSFLVVFGLYRPLTAALANPFSDLSGTWRRFGPFFLAAAAGLLLGSRILAAVFARYESPTIFLFMGLMAGGIPGLYQHVKKTKTTWSGRLAFTATLGLCLALAYWQTRLVPRGEPVRLHWGIWFLSGTGIGLGTVLPGVSVAFLLIHFGLYQPMLEGVATLDTAVWLPVGAGAAMAVLLFARAAHWLYQIAEGPVNRGTLGLVVGSLFLVFPGWPGGWLGGLCLALLLLGFSASFTLNVLSPPT